MSTLIFIYFLKYETIETHARTFLTLDILSIGTVSIDGTEKRKHYSMNFNAQINICVKVLCNTRFLELKCNPKLEIEYILR